MLVYLLGEKRIFSEAEGNELSLEDASCCSWLQARAGAWHSEKAPPKFEG